MAWSATSAATRLSAARSSELIEFAKYSVMATSPNAIHSTMMSTEPLCRPAPPGDLNDRRSFIGSFALAW